MEVQSGVELNKNIFIILVAPQLGENIGASARLMLNFGFTNLRIVQPRDHWPNEKALSVSVGANFIIEKAEIFNSLEEAMSDINYCFALSARSRNINKPMIYSSEIKNETEIFTTNQKIAFMFGPENSGLSNTHLSLSNKLITIPTNKNFQSINLAQSVGIICYEIFKNNFEHNQINSYEPASFDDFNLFFDHLTTELSKKNFFNEADKKKHMIQNLQSIFTRVNNLSSQDIKILRGIITSLSTNTNPKI
jgi:tRNA/rRNA methyltransferase